MLLEYAGMRASLKPFVIAGGSMAQHGSQMLKCRKLLAKGSLRIRFLWTLGFSRA